MSKHIQKEERVTIQTLLAVGQSIDNIAKHLGRHRSTIYREMSRAGVCSNDYDAELYHQQARSNMIRNQENNNPNAETVVLIEQLIIQKQWSPEQISNWLKLNKDESVSHTWIYQHIAKDRIWGGELSNHLRRGGRPYSKGPVEYKGKIKNRISIDNRPDIVQARNRLGDYEIDLIVGAKNKGAILTAVDRASRECMITKLQNKSALAIEFAVVEALRNKAKTITSDNGNEFTNHQNIAQKVNADYYFANPYASYERGSIENLNGLIRQYIPKGSDLDAIEQDQLDIIADKLNNRPRKILNFLSPLEYTSKYNTMQKNLDLSHLRV